MVAQPRVMELLKGAKVPKPVLDVREKLAGMEINADTLKNNLSKADLNKLGNNFRSRMNTEARNAYNKLITDEQRRARLAQYVIDPASANCTGTNETKVHASKEQRDDAGWLHECQIAGPNYMNDKELAHLLCESGELESRASEYPCFANKGLTQYWFSMTMLRSVAGQTDTASVQATSELTEQEYEEVKASMQINIGTRSSSSNKRKTTAKEPESAEKKKREMESFKQAQMRKLKALTDKVHNEVAKLTADIPSLSAKGYPEAMQEWCVASLVGIKDSMKRAQDAYNEEIVKVKADHAELADIEAVGKHLDAELQTLERAYSEWKKGPGAEVKKLVG